MSVNAYEKMVDFVKSLLTDEEFARDFAEDQQGKLAAEGVTDHDLCGVDMPEVVQEASAAPEVPQETKSALQGYTSGGSGPAQQTATAQQSMEQVVQHLNYVTYETYEDNDVITNLLDQSVDVDVSGPVFGDLDVDAVTGEKGQIIEGDNFGQANTGDGAVLAGDDASGVNTGANTGINAGDDVENAVVGDGNKTTQNSGDDSPVGEFGSGEFTNIPGALSDGPTIVAGGCYTGGTNGEDNYPTADTHLDLSGLDADYTPCDKRAGFEDNDAIVVGGDAAFATQ